MKSSLKAFSCFTALMACLTAGRTATGQLVTHPFIHNGYSRPYLVYTPSHPAPHMAVVFVLGGVGSSAASNSREMGWVEEAEHKGFIVLFPELATQNPLEPFVKYTNTTFWEMQGSRSRILAPNAFPVDDDGYLMAVLHEVLHTQPTDRKRVFFAGFSSGSGEVQLIASRHPEAITAIVAVATPLMEPPLQLRRPVAVLYIHGDDDEQFSGFEVHSPDFATTPHGNWVTWGYLDGCHTQRAKRTSWGVQFTWEGCKNQTPVIADFVHGLGHEWLTSKSSWNLAHRSKEPLDFTDLAWQFFAAVRPH